MIDEIHAPPSLEITDKNLKGEVRVYYDEIVVRDR
jgi:hypothetical protein